MKRSFPTRFLRLGIAAGLLSLLALGALARIADFDVVCPLFGHQFTAQTMVSDDDFSAFDSDFCKWSRGQNPYLFAVWTCPYCFFSAYQADFRGSVDARFRDMKLRRYPVEADSIQQHEIFVSTKYLNAETYYLEAGRDARFLADLALRGSYACRVLQMEETPEFESLRDKIVDDVLAGKKRISVERVNLDVVARVREMLDGGQVEGRQLQVYRYLLADALRRAGESIEAREILEEIQEEGSLPAAYLETAKQKAFLCMKEGEFQEKTLAYLKEAREEGLIPQAERARTTYLRAELSRRLGRLEEARQLFQEAAAIPTEEEWLGSMIENQLRRIPAAEDAAAVPGR